MPDLLTVTQSGKAAWKKLDPSMDGTEDDILWIDPQTDNTEDIADEDFDDDELFNQDFMPIEQVKQLFDR